MSGMGDWAENKVIDHITGVGAWTAPTTLYVHLLTATPTDADNTGTPVSGGSYAPLAVAAGSTNWNAASGGATSNKLDLTYTTPSADWGNVTHFAIKDSATFATGHTVYWGPLTAAKNIQNGDPVLFPAGSLVITQD